jgi:hypothetical protein
MGARYLRLYPSSSIALTLRRGGNEYNTYG